MGGGPGKRVAEGRDRSCRSESMANAHNNQRERKIVRIFNVRPSAMAFLERVHDLRSSIGERIRTHVPGRGFAMPKSSLHL